ncbi:hypothetical protein MNBD_ALPHA12-1794 [hydrothermal vent metagenome]|uniref:Uncharacterized protein n=1 Tax=hydrothermal vent metagenome TaxID=652676 RepID=A0A3B0U3U8_9ZZZZ
MTEHTKQLSTQRQDEYVTIIAPSLAAVMGQFRARGLGAKGFAITGPAARHQFAFAGKDESMAGLEMFGGVAMVAATFRRVIAAH